MGSIPPPPPPQVVILKTCPNITLVVGRKTPTLTFLGANKKDKWSWILDLLGGDNNKQQRGYTPQGQNKISPSLSSNFCKWLFSQPWLVSFWNVPPTLKLVSQRVGGGGINWSSAPSKVKATYFFSILQDCLEYWFCLHFVICVYKMRTWILGSVVFCWKSLFSERYCMNYTQQHISVSNVSSIH